MGMRIFALNTVVELALVGGKQINHLLWRKERQIGVIKFYAYSLKPDIIKDSLFDR